MTASLAETLPEGFSVRQGPLLLCHAADLAKDDIAPADLERLCRFRLIVTNGYGFPAARVTQALRAHGCKLFHYFWANGFTEGERLSTSLPDGLWRQKLRREHPEWLLAAEPLAGPPGTPASYYYDFAHPEGVAFLAAQIARTRAQGGYAGTFFDYAGAYALPKAVAELWQRKHPGVPYDRALARFFVALRAADPQTLIFTNQSVLGDPTLLPTSDYDMVESYGTSFLWGPVAKLKGEDFPLSFRRPWDGPGGIKAMYGPLRERLKQAPPRGGLFCLDYMRPHLEKARGAAVLAAGPHALPREDGDWRQVTDIEAVYYSYCVAALWGLESYCSGWYGLEYQGPLYFADLGRPLGEGPEEAGGMVIREYERGLVALLAEPRAAQVTWRLRANSGPRLCNLLTGRPVAVRDGKVTLRLRSTRTPLTEAAYPVGRVFLKTN
jgi:hypothetical protein